MSNLAGVLISLAAACAWGLLYAQVQWLDRTLPSSSLLAAAYVAGAVILSPVVVTQSLPIMRTIRKHPRYFLSCLLSLLVAELLIFYSIHLLGGTEASLIEVSYPLWTALFLFLTAGERPVFATKVGGTLIMLGVVLIIIGNEEADKKNPI